jgi:amino acid permease
MKILKNIPDNYFSAIAVTVGYIIGVGMFGLPYLVSKAGVIPFLLFIFGLGAVQHLLHLIYANLIIVTSGYHRLPGYVELYLGKKGKNIVFVAKMVGNMGALLAYIIITGIFLHELLSPLLGGSEFLYASILFFLEAIVIYFGIGMIARVELFMTGLLLFIIALITWKGLGFINFTNYITIEWKYLLIPYGAVLFALDGCGSMPIVARLLKKNTRAIKSVIRLGTVIPIFIMIVFTFVIVGISGAATTPDALTGIRDILQHDVVILALIFGIFTMITSFFGVAESVKETLQWDYKLEKNIAWAMAVFIPYVFYVIGLKNLISVISFAGGVAGGASAIILIIIFIKLKKDKSKLVLFKKDKLRLFNYKPGNILTYFLITLFALGIMYEIYNFFSG